MGARLALHECICIWLSMRARLAARRFLQGECVCSAVHECICLAVHECTLARSAVHAGSLVDWGKKRNWVWGHASREAFA
eukprot:1159139-Pelagomonas_calceolata.AAC.7